MVKRYRITNIYQGDDFFEMEAREQRAALEEIWSEERGWSLLAIYHSHPVSPAYPSARDIRPMSASSLRVQPGMKRSTQPTQAG